MSPASRIFAHRSEHTPTGVDLKKTRIVFNKQNSLVLINVLAINTYHMTIPTSFMMTESSALKKCFRGSAWAPIEPIVEPKAMQKTISPGYDE